MEAPKPTTSNDLKTFEYSNLQNEKKYNWKFITSYDSIEMNIYEINSLPPLYYQNTYSRNDLEKLNKFFLMFDDIYSISSEIERRIKENLYEFEINEKELTITFNIEITSIKSFSFKLPLKENKNVNSLVNELFKIVKDLDLKIQNLENENKKIKTELKEIKNENQNLKNSICDLLKKEEKKNNNLNEEFIDSTIIENNDEKKLIFNWINPLIKFKTKLLYRCSIDGDSSKTFHEKCDGKGPTITLIKTNDGFRFGGYASISWNNESCFQKDKNAFIFSLNKKQKYNIKNENNAIFGGIVNGPIFGLNEIYIINNCKTKGGICSNPVYYNFSFAGEFSGSEYFNVMDYEVFLLING